MTTPTQNKINQMPIQELINLTQEEVKFLEFKRKAEIKAGFR